MVTILTQWLAIGVAAYACLVLFYLWYMSSVQIVSNWRDLATWVKASTAPSVLLFVLFDWLIQHTLAVALFADFAQERMLTQRLQRYRENPQYTGTWRARVATIICTQALNPFDPSKKHC